MSPGTRDPGPAPAAPAAGAGEAYRAAGVDIDAGERAVELMAGAVARTRRPEVVGGLGGFAGLFRLDLTRWRAPLLATSTDGVGTKVALAQALDRHDTIGIDLVAMVVDDLVVCGAEPLFLTDYLACGRVDPERVATVVGGIAEGCRQAGCALLGGETAEHPGLLPPEAYDLAGAAVGAVEAEAVLGAERVRAGDAIVAMASSGVHANGFSLVRHVVGVSGLEPAQARPHWEVPAPFAPEVSLGEALLTPTRVYARDCLALAAAGGVRVFAHVTGGGLAGNLARVVPGGLAAVVDRATWTPPPVFGWLAAAGRLDLPDLERTVNMGVGMLAVVAPEAAQGCLRQLAGAGVPAWVCGEVQPGEGPGSARLVGAHPPWRG